MKLNVQMIRNYIKDNDLMVGQLSTDVFGSKGYLSVILSRGECGEESLKKIADYTGLSEQELTDETRMETSTGKVLYKENIPLPDKTPSLTRRFLQKCVDRTDLTKVDMDKIFPCYQWFAWSEQEIPKPREAFIESLRSAGVNIVREYGKVYATGCKPYNSVEQWTEKHAQEQERERLRLESRLNDIMINAITTKKPVIIRTEPASALRADVLKNNNASNPLDTLHSWAMGLLLDDGKDEVGIVALLRKIKEVEEEFGQ